MTFEVAVETQTVTNPSTNKFPHCLVLAIGPCMMTLGNGGPDSPSRFTRTVYYLYQKRASNAMATVLRGGIDGRLFQTWIYVRKCVWEYLFPVCESSLLKFVTFWCVSNDCSKKIETYFLKRERTSQNRSRLRSRSYEHDFLSSNI